MVFEKIKNTLKGRNDPSSLRGLEQFTPEQRKRILGKIGDKEAEIMELKADVIVARRVARMEKSAGIGKQDRDNKGMNVMGNLKKFKDFREGNLKRHAEKKTGESSSGILNVKPIKLKAPPVGD